MGGKPSASIMRNIPHSLAPMPGSLAPFLVAAFSVPLGLLLGLGIQGESSAYVISVISFGLLTSLDLRTGLLRRGLGFAVSLLALSYAIENSIIGQALSPLPFGGWSLLLVSLPPSLGVFLSTFVFSRKGRYKIPMANVLASLAMGIGLGLGSVMRMGVDPSVESIMPSLIIFVPLGLAANSVQTVLLHFLEKLWKAGRISLAMMPTAFFAYNSLVVFAYLTSPTGNAAYTFFSSLGFLPALSLTAVGVQRLTERVPPGPQVQSTPTITLSGEHSVRPGQTQTIRIVAQTRGRPKDMPMINATVRTPAGNIQPLKLSHVSLGKYKVSWQPTQPGSYATQVTVTSKEHQTLHESFTFTVQSPPPRHQPPPPPQPQSRPAQPPRPQAPPTRQAPPMPQGTTGLPRLDSWDPRIWVNQEVHGYKIKEYIATGASGYVLRATFGQVGTEMALKIPILRTGTGTTALNETMSEATRLLELSGQSKYVVQIRGMLVDRLNIQEIVKGDTALYLRSPPAIVMEFMNGGNAKRLLEDPSYDSLYYSEKWGAIVMLVGYMIAMALETIHDAGFVHLDVKPQNILFNTKPPVTGHDMMEQLQSGALLPKLADLGSAVRTGGKVVQFTSEYAPGEQVLGSSASPSMDIYALGATIYTMLTKTPVHSKKLIEVMNNLTNNPDSNRVANDLKSSWNSFTPDFTRIDPKFSSAISVMKDLVARDPRHRPVARDAAASLRNLAGKHGASLH